MEIKMQIELIETKKLIPYENNPRIVETVLAKRKGRNRWLNGKTTG
jgi:hypothetical protein